MQWGQAVHNFIYRLDDRTDVTVHSAPDLRARLLCHLLIGYLPEGALREAQETLMSIYSYYNDQAQLELPETPAVPVPAEHTGSYDSPLFEIVEG